MHNVSWNDAVRLSRQSLRAVQVKRFYDTVSLGKVDGGWQLLLDGRAAHTPGKNKLLIPVRVLAETVASEWTGQGEFLIPAEMPLTRLANSALDGVAHALEATVAEVAGYAGADLVCYRALEPEGLVSRQAEAFDPVLAFAEQRLGALFRLAGGIMHVEQTPASLAAVRAAVAAHSEPFALTALHGLTSLSGSVLIALAITRGVLAAEAGWRAAHVDEDFQIELWGADADAERRRAARWREFAAAAFVLDAVKDAAR